MLRKRQNLRILISGGYGNANAGDEALMLNMLVQLRSVFENPAISIFSDDPVYSREKYPEEEFIYSGRFGFFEPNKRGLRRIYWIFRAIKAFVLCGVFITGGGTILQDQTHPFFVPFWLSKIVFAQLLMKKTVMYGIGAGPLTSMSGRILTRIFVNNMSLLTLRGHYSYETLRETGVKKPPMRILSDPAMGLAHASPHEVEAILKREGWTDVRGFKVAFAIRRWYVGHRNNIRDKTWIQGGKQKYDKLVNIYANLADYFIANFGAAVFFVPMSIKYPNDDRIAARDTLEMMQEKNSVIIIEREYSPEETKGILGAMDFLVGMRFHSLVFYSEFLKPMVGIGYGRKTYDFMNYLGLAELVCDVDDLTFETAKELVNRSLEVFKNPRSRDVLEASVKRLKEKALENAKWVKMIIEQNRQQKTLTKIQTKQSF